MKISLKNSFITDNSKECEQNCYFLKCFLNKAYEAEAKARGASVISPKEAFALLKIKKSLKIIGITGTNGKTTTSSAIYSFLLDLGAKTALCGTRGFFINDELKASKSLTTPINLALLSYLNMARDCDYFVMEVSSHAIAQERCEGLDFHAKLFTNFSQDHLDYHKSLAEYKSIKESFFKDEGFKLINADENDFLYNYKSSLTYAIENPAYYKIKAYSCLESIEALVGFGSKEYSISSTLQGLFNLYNLLAASALVNELLKPKKEELERAICNFGGVKGRLEEIKEGIFIDFAHSPDGIKRVLDALKHRPLIVIMGAGGDRDKSKRALMGKIAQKYAKSLIITSDNPRFEEPLSIIKDIEKGLLKSEGVYIKEDRKEALKLGLKLKKEKDYLVILGKGDEEYQEIRGEKIAFNDEKIILKLLKDENENTNAI